MAVRKGLAVIERALLQLPERCRYHGDEIDRGGELWTRRACCDTGFPALLRREALRDLAVLDARPPLDRMTAQQCPAGLHPDWGRRQREHARLPVVRTRPGARRAPAA